MTDIFIGTGGRPLTRADADKDIFLDSHSYQSNQVRVDITGLPDTWEFAGTAYKIITIDGVDLIVEKQQVYNHGRTLINWVNETLPYKIKFRFVDYLTSCQSELWEVYPNGVPLDGFLDAFPNGIPFGVERGYSNYAGPIYEPLSGNIERLYAQSSLSDTILEAVDIVQVSEQRYLFGSDSALLSSEGRVRIQVPYLYAAIYRPLQSYQGTRLQIFSPQNNFGPYIDTDGLVKATIRTQGADQQVIGTAERFDDWNLLVLSVTQDSTQLWQNGVKTYDVNHPRNIQATNQVIRIPLQGIEHKLGALWQIAGIPDPDALSQSLINSFNIP